MRTTLAALLVAGPVFFWPALVGAQEIQWRYDYNTARKEAEKRGLPLVLDFGTDNCPWCVKLDETTFRDPTVARVVNDKFVPLKIDGNKEVELTRMLGIRTYPTVILAGPDGKILGTIQGYKEAFPFHEDLQRALTAVTNPEWMQRDYQVASKAVNDQDYVKAVALLKTILEDGKNRPVQVNAGNLLKQVEQQAAAELAQAKQMIDKGHTNEATARLTRLVKDYAGTAVAPEAAGMLTSMAKTPEMRNQQTTVRARELLAQAKDDYRSQQWLCCLDRCDLLTAKFGDTSESAEAAQMAGAIRSNPEWMQQACESMTERLGQMYLSQAEGWLQKGQPQQAMLCLERVVRTMPNTRQAEAAAFRLSQLQGLPTQRAGFRDPTKQE